LSIITLDIARQDVRQTNRRMVLSEIMLNGPISRTKIAQRTGLTTASVSRISREIITAGLVVEGETLPSPNRPGRRFIAIDVNPAGGYVLGISINALQQFITLADLKNRPLARRELSLESTEDAEDVLNRVAQAANEMILDAGVPRARLFGGSVSVAGAVDPENGLVHSAPTLGWENVCIGGFLSNALGIQIHVENMPNAMNLAETRFGIGRGYGNVVLLNAALGIGGSLLLDNRLIRGNNFSAGLVGAMSLWRDAQGRSLSVDEVAGGWGVLRNIFGETAVESASSPGRHLLDAMKAAETGDDTAHSALRKSGRSLANVIETIAEIVHPEIFIVSGALASSSSYVEGVRAGLAEAWSSESSSIPVHVSNMTGQAAARWLAINEFLLQRNLDLEHLNRDSAA